MVFYRLPTESIVNCTEMLHPMCHELLSESDVRAICKSRGLPAQAASSRGVLEGLFLSSTGVAAAFAGLDRREIAVLHLLKAIDKPVDVSFFSRIDTLKGEALRHGTFTQRYQGAFSKAKERFVRRGLLILALGYGIPNHGTKMERWRFALPASFVPHLPPLLESPQALDSPGDWRSDVVRQKLREAVGGSSASGDKSARLAIVDRQLQFGGEPFQAARLLAWQMGHWHRDMSPKRDRKTEDPTTPPPAAAARQILAGLGDGQWSDAEGLTAALQIFCGSAVDSRSVCESGWRWGCLARQESEGKTWYRLAPQTPDSDAAPHTYLDVTADGRVTVDLDLVPLLSLEQLVKTSDQSPGPGGRPVLIVAPNLTKLGRAADDLVTLPLFAWLENNSPDFAQAIQTYRQRRGKTILHENLAVARVADLALKVALEKALGGRVVPLGDEHIAFPKCLLDEVKRVVTKSGHVVKEAAPHGS